MELGSDVPGLVNDLGLDGYCFAHLILDTEEPLSECGVPLGNAECVGLQGLDVALECDANHVDRDR